MWILWALVAVLNILRMVSEAMQGHAWLACLSTFGACCFTLIAVSEWLDKYLND